MFALTDGETETPLIQGKTVIGRSAVPVEGVSFISLESPRAAISRMQAFIEVAPNGDAWIADCNSTNGTFLAIRDGAGVRLEPNHYYQLTEGCRIVFGDVERQFVRLLAANRSVDGSQAAQEHPGTPYLRQSDIVRAIKETPKTSPSKHQREDAVSAVSLQRGEEPAEPLRKAPRTRSSTAGAASKVSTQTVACFTGMDGGEKAAAKKAMKRIGARATDDVRKATLLVVKAPSTRTPKFLIAVGRGIPIVTEKILDVESITEDCIEHFGASLVHDKTHYSRSALHSAIHRKHHLPILEGLSFNITELPANLRASSQEVILGCGGAIKKSKKDATVLSESTLNELYDAILRGKRPAE